MVIINNTDKDKHYLGKMDGIVCYLKAVYSTVSSQQ